nr:MAG TPA: hypothetical protein [Caudoviricetes sp.]
MKFLHLRKILSCERIREFVNLKNRFTLLQSSSADHG